MGMGTVPIVPIIVSPRLGGANHTNKYKQQKRYPVLLHAVEEHGDWTPVTSHGMVPWSGPERGLSNTDRTPVHGKPVTHTHTHTLRLVTCTGGLAGSPLDKSGKWKVVFRFQEDKSERASDEM